MQVRHIISVIALATLSQGCAVGPDASIPVVPTTSTFSGSTTKSDATDFNAWWARARQPKLARLIDEALDKNADLEVALRALRVAQANASAQFGAFFPAATAGFDHLRQKVPAIASSPLANDENLFTLRTAQVSVSFAPDIFGGRRRAYESAAAQADAQAFALHGAALSLSTNIGVTAVQEAALEEQIRVAQSMIKIQEQLLGVLRNQYAAGQIGQIDVSAQETSLAQTKLLLPPLEKQLAQQRNLLAVLVGQSPGETSLPRFQLSDFRALPPVRPGTPADLLLRRPDVKAAAEQVKAANAQIGVAIANRLPQITLTAQASSSATALDKVLTPGTGGFAFGAGLLQPVFDAGALAARQTAAEEATAQAMAQYRSVALGAVQNVADALSAIHHDGRAVEAARAARASAQLNFDLTRKQVETGQVSAASLLASQQALLQSSLALAQAEGSRYANYFALVQALGGGWWDMAQADGYASALPARRPAE